MIRKYGGREAVPGGRPRYFEADLEAESVAGEVPAEGDLGRSEPSDGLLDAGAQLAGHVLGGLDRLASDGRSSWDGDSYGQKRLAQREGLPADGWGVGVLGDPDRHSELEVGRRDETEVERDVGMELER